MALKVILIFLGCGILVGAAVGVEERQETAICSAEKRVTQPIVHRKILLVFLLAHYRVCIFLYN